MTEIQQLIDATLQEMAEAQLDALLARAKFQRAISKKTGHAVSIVDLPVGTIIRCMKCEAIGATVTNTRCPRA